MNILEVNNKLTLSVSQELCARLQNSELGGEFIYNVVKPDHKSRDHAYVLQLHRKHRKALSEILHDLEVDHKYL